MKKSPGYPLVPGANFIDLKLLDGVINGQGKNHAS